MKKHLTIIGAGIPGLALAIDCLRQFGHKRVEVELWEAASRPNQQSDGDQRTTAFLPPSIDYFDQLGVWASLEPFAASLKTLRLVDDRGGHHSKPLIETFEAQEFGVEAFAQNLANSALRLALIERAETLGATIHWASRFDTSRLHEKNAENDESNTLFVGADGRNSATRQALGIELDQRTPNQTAIVCTATHTLTQNAVSTEFHRDAGPFTLVPALPDMLGHHRTAIVWVERPDTVQALLALAPDRFAARLQENARGLLGEVLVTSTPAAIPVATQQSMSLGKPGALLMAEAAHALPPIGAQGLNLSIADAKTLGQLLVEVEDWRSPALLTAYERKRSADIGLRLNATDALNRVTTWQSWLRTPLTLGALGLLKHIKPVRDVVVKTGMGL